jgi:hypothetical protein
MNDEVLATVRLVVETTGKRTERFVGQYTVPANEETAIALKLEGPSKAEIEELAFSGSAQLIVDATAKSGRQASALSEPLYFHPDGGDLIVYEETVLQDTFGSGRFAEPIKEETEFVELRDGTIVPIVTVRVSIPHILSEEEIATMRRENVGEGSDFRGK